MTSIPCEKNAELKDTLSERGMDGGWFGWSVTASAWWDWNAAAFIGPQARAVVMLSAYPGVHACIALTGPWGWRAFAVGPGDVLGAALSGGWQRRLGPFVVAGVDKRGGPNLRRIWRRVLERVSGIECGWWRP